MRTLPPIDTGQHATLFDESPVAAEARALRAEIQQLARALATAWGDGWFFSHIAAAVLWGLPLPIRLLRRCASNLDVAVRGAHRAPRGRGIRGHQLAPDALRSIDHLAAALNAGRRTGASRLRAALPHICVGAASLGETRIRLGILAAGLPTPELDYDVIARDGRAIGFTELAHPAFRLLHEYEGDHHRLDRRQWNRDIEKHAACVAEGWDVTRLTAEHAYPTTTPAVAKVRAALERAGWQP